MPERNPYLDTEALRAVKKYVRDSLSSLSGSIDSKLLLKQDTLVSGTNIKTINGQSILGPGDITAVGPQGPEGPAGADGQDGITPHIDSTTGHWFLGSTDTGVDAQGPQGNPGQNGTNGQDGHTPVMTINLDGYWCVDGVSTGVKAQGPAGADGTNGTNGTDGVTPHIDSSSKHWFIGSTDTGILAEGVNGTNGLTPTIDPSTKHWLIGSTDTGVVAEGQDGTNGTNGQDGITPHIDSTTKHWMIGSTDTGVVAEGQTPTLKTLDGDTLTGSGDIKTGKVEKIVVSVLATGLTVLTIADLAVRYSHLLMFGHSQYADGYEQVYVIDLTDVASNTVTISRSIPGWQDPLNAYFFSNNGDLDWNGGSSHIIYMTSVFGVCKTA